MNESSKKPLKHLGNSADMSGKIPHSGDIFTWLRNIFFLLFVDLREKVTFIRRFPKKQRYFRRLTHTVNDYVCQALC